MPAQHNRVTPAGQELGAEMVRLTTPAIAQLVAEGEPDARCASCAFRLGTVPNGCAQTQLDVFKAVMEGTVFYCHGHADETPTTPCHGWYAARVALKGVRRRVPYDFSPPDDPTFDTQGKA